MTEYLFVYGTLRTGGVNSSFLDGMRMVQVASISGFELYRNPDDGYIFIVEGHGTIIGEVYEVNSETLTHLDEFEECPEVYIRKAIKLGDITAWVYVFSNPPNASSVRISNGDWIAYLNQ
jgi:gamma-glutamylcyclotransferase (GGCT)/AIG2-like uncharacterized protein YtfP